MANSKLTIIPIVIPRGRSKDGDYRVTLVFRFAVNVPGGDVDTLLRYWPSKIKKLLETTNIEVSSDETVWDSVPVNWQTEEISGDHWAKTLYPQVDDDFVDAEDVKQVAASDARHGLAYASNKKSMKSPVSDFAPEVTFERAPQYDEVRFGVAERDAAVGLFDSDSESKSSSQRSRALSKYTKNVGIAGGIIDAGRNRGVLRAAAEQSFVEIEKAAQEMQVGAADQAALDVAILDGTSERFKRKLQEWVSKANASDIRAREAKIKKLLISVEEGQTDVGSLTADLPEIRSEIETFLNICSRVRNTRTRGLDGAQPRKKAAEIEEKIRRHSFRSIYSRCSQYPGLMRLIGFYVEGTFSSSNKEKITNSNSIRLSSTKFEEALKAMYKPDFSEFEQVWVNTGLWMPSFGIPGGIPGNPGPAIEPKFLVKIQKSVVKFKESDDFWPKRRGENPFPKFSLSQYDGMAAVAKLRGGAPPTAPADVIFILEDRENPRFKGRGNKRSDHTYYAEDLEEGIEVSVKSGDSKFVSLCSREVRLWDGLPSELRWNETVGISRAITSVPAPLVGQLEDRSRAVAFWIGVVKKATTGVHLGFIADESKKMIQIAAAGVKHTFDLGSGHGDIELFDEIVSLIEKMSLTESVDIPVFLDSWLEERILLKLSRFFNSDKLSGTDVALPFLRYSLDAEFRMRVIGTEKKKTIGGAVVANDISNFQFSGSHSFRIIRGGLGTGDSGTAIRCVHRPHAGVSELYASGYSGGNDNFLENDAIRLVVRQNEAQAEDIEIFPLFLLDKPITRNADDDLQLRTLSSNVPSRREDRYLLITHSQTRLSEAGVGTEDAQLTEKRFIVEGIREYAAFGENSLQQGTPVFSLPEFSDSIHCYSSDLPLAPISLAHIEFGEGKDDVIGFTSVVGNNEQWLKVDLRGRPELVRGECRKVRVRVEGILGRSPGLQVEKNILKIPSLNNHIFKGRSGIFDHELSELKDGLLSKPAVIFEIERGSSDEEWEVVQSSRVGDSKELFNAESGSEIIGDADLSQRVRQLREDISITVNLTIQMQNGEYRDIEVSNGLRGKSELMSDGTWIEPWTVVPGTIGKGQLLEVVVDSSASVRHARAWPRMVYGSADSSGLICPDGEFIERIGFEVIDKPLTGFWDCSAPNKAATVANPKHSWIAEVAQIIWNTDSLVPEFQIEFRPGFSENSWYTKGAQDLGFPKESGGLWLSHEVDELTIRSRIADLSKGDVAVLNNPVFTRSGVIFLDAETIESSFLLGSITDAPNTEVAAMARVKESIDGLSRVQIATPRGVIRSVWIPDDDLVKSVLSLESERLYMLPALPAIIAKSVVEYRHSRRRDAKVKIKIKEQNENGDGEVIKEVEVSVSDLDLSTTFVDPALNESTEPVRMIESGHLCQFNGWSLVVPDPGRNDEEASEDLDIPVTSYPTDRDGSKAKLESLRYGKKYQFRFRSVNAAGVVENSDDMSESNELLFKRPYEPGLPMIGVPRDPESTSHEGLNSLEYVVGEVNQSWPSNQLIAVTDSLSIDPKPVSVRDHVHVFPPPVGLQTMLLHGILDRSLKNVADKNRLQDFVEAHEEAVRLGAKGRMGQRKGDKAYRFNYFPDPLMWPIRVTLRSKFGRSRLGENAAMVDEKPQWLSFFNNGKTTESSSLIGFKDLQNKGLMSAHIGLEKEGKNPPGLLNNRILNFTLGKGKAGGINIPPGASAVAGVRCALPADSDKRKSLKILEWDGKLERDQEEVEVEVLHATTLPLVAPRLEELAIKAQRKPGDSIAIFGLKGKAEAHTTGFVSYELYWNEYFDQRVGLNQVPAVINLVADKSGGKKFEIVESGAGYGSVCDVVARKRGDGNAEMFVNATVKVVDGSIYDISLWGKGGSDEMSIMNSPHDYEIHVRSRKPLQSFASALFEAGKSTLKGEENQADSFELNATVIDSGDGYRNAPFAVILNPIASLPRLTLSVALKDGKVHSIVARASDQSDFRAIIGVVPNKIESVIFNGYRSYLNKEGAEPLVVGLFTNHKEILRQPVGSPATLWPDVGVFEELDESEVLFDFGHPWSVTGQGGVSGTTRFAEVLTKLEKLRENGKEVVSVSAPRSVSGAIDQSVTIPATERPPMLQVHDLSLAFQWETEGSVVLRDEQVFAWEGYAGAETKDGFRRAVIRRESFPRVYVRRPWNVSGRESIAVVLGRPLSVNGSENVVQYHKDKGLPKQLRQFVSRWGMDPLWAEMNFPALGKHHFSGGVGHVPSVQLAESGKASMQVDALLYEMDFSEELGLWYSDIRLKIPHGDIGGRDAKKQNKESNTGLPFAQLALSRFQVDAIGGKEMSEVTLADPIRLAGNHELRLSVTKEGLLVELDVPFHSQSDNFNSSALPRQRFFVEFRLERGTGFDSSILGPLLEYDDDGLRIDAEFELNAEDSENTVFSRVITFTEMPSYTGKRKSSKDAPLFLIVREENLYRTSEYQPYGRNSKDGIKETGSLVPFACSVRLGGGEDALEEKVDGPGEIEGPNTKNEITIETTKPMGGGLM